LRGIDGGGLILSNGEFGERLADAARRFGLRFDLLQAPWGEAFDMKRVEQSIENHRPTWLWCVHCETSTGVLNDLPALSELCANRDVRLCADCISSIGNVPLDLRRVWLATATSGKGIAAMSGIAMVFHRDPIGPNPSLPRYLDLGMYAQRNGVPFTFSSNLLAALKVALQAADPGGWLAQSTAMSQELRCGLAALGMRVIADAAHGAPAVTTIEVPPPMTSAQLGGKLGRLGYLLGYESDYLLERNWVQVCLMGEHGPAEIGGLLDALRALLEERHPEHAHASAGMAPE